jgi:ABC-type branched-subunit amino acid transport system substrate-binding protein
MPLPIRSIFVVVLLAVASASVAQPIEIGVVLSLSGPFSTEGTVAAATLEAVFDGWRRRAPDFVDAIEVAILDDRSDPLAAERSAEALIDEGAHALVCCSSDAALGRVAALAEEHGVLLFSLRPPSGSEGVWEVALGPSEASLLRSVVRHAFAAGRSPLGLMTLATPFGSHTQEVLERELAAAGMELRGIARYAIDTRPLTPDALWVATREPSAVVVWGLRDDGVAAVDALRRRGYSGPVYLRPSLAAADPASAAPEGVLLPLPPFVLAQSLPEGHANSGAVAEYGATVVGRLGTAYRTPGGALAADLATLLLRALEQVSLYGVAPVATEQFRLALRDAAIGLPTLHGAAGSYDVRDGAAGAALPEGLPVGRSVGGGFVFAPGR